MALGKVSVNNLNLGQGPVTEIERYFLFIGPAPANVGRMVPLNTQSDLDASLGAADSDLKTQITAARLNGGDRWACMAAPIAAVGGQWANAVDQSQREGVAVEAVIITTPVTTGAELTAMQAKAVEVENIYGRRLFIMAATAGIDLTPPATIETNQQEGTQAPAKSSRATAKTVPLVEAEDAIPRPDWVDYYAEQKVIVSGVSAPRVMVVPQLHGNDQGVLAGRLANAHVSIADSPMRVATGPLLGLGPVPVDINGMPLPTAVRVELDRARFSVSQLYSDYPGVYWADGNLLDAPGSDYQVIENLRIVDKAARRVRILLIQRVADRRLNNTPNSMAAATSAFTSPLRDMARAATVFGKVQPGDIEPPKDGDVTLFWKTKTAVEVYIKCRPFNCPKDLTANIALDLSNDGEE
jgi:hypothetical protein